MTEAARAGVGRRRARTPRGGQARQRRGAGGARPVRRSPSSAYTRPTAPRMKRSKSTWLGGKKPAPAPADDPPPPTIPHSATSADAKHFGLENVRPVLLACAPPSLMSADCAA
jgi:hypothetical protein